MLYRIHVIYDVRFILPFALFWHLPTITICLQSPKICLACKVTKNISLSQMPTSQQHTTNKQPYSLLTKSPLHMLLNTNTTLMELSVLNSLNSKHSLNFKHPKLYYPSPKNYTNLSSPQNYTIYTSLLFPRPYPVLTMTRLYPNSGTNIIQNRPKSKFISDFWR